MRRFRRLVLLAVLAGGAAASLAFAEPASATCHPGRFTVKPLVIEFPQCYPPGGGPE